MNPIVFSFILCIIWAVVVQLINKRVIRDKVYLYPTFILILIIHAFVDIDSVPDLPVYKSAFDVVATTPWDRVYKIYSMGYEKMEVGFLYTMKCITSIGGDFRLFLFVTSLLIIIPYYKISEKYSQSVILSILMFLLLTNNQSTFVLRQHIAIGITLLSYPYIIERKHIKFLLLMLIAFLFHKTAIIFLPIYYIYGIKSPKRTIILLSISFIVALFAMRFLFMYLGGLVGGYDTYILDDENGTNAKTGIFYTLYLVCYIVFCGKKCIEPGMNRFILYTLIISCIINVAGLGLSLISRLGLYYNVILILAIPLIYANIKNNGLKYAFLIITLLVFGYINFGGSRYEFIAPYALSL